MNKTIIPKLSISVICANILNIEKDLDILEDGGIDYLHFDIMDGKYVPRTGLSISILKKITSRYNIPVEIHLMVEDPYKYIDGIAEAGGSIIIFHPEGRKDMNKILYEASRYILLKLGLALKPETPIEILVPYLEKIDTILLMAYPPGTLGEKPMANFPERIRSVRNLISDHNRKDIDIAVDGNVNTNNLKKYLDNGASVFVLGTSGLFIDGAELKSQLNLIKKTLHIIH